MLMMSFDRSRRVLAMLAFSLVLAACGGGGGGESTQGADPDSANESGAPASAPEVIIENFTFMPGELEVPAGTTVTWTNKDDNAHTVKDEGGAGFQESEDLAEGDTFTFTYANPGSYPYICGIHPYMKATVVVS